MSTGHLKYEKKTAAELYEFLGQGDTPKFYARRPTLNVCYDWPYAGGNSVDGATVFIDRTLYREVMDGKVYVRGMTPSQIISAWREHEHTEWAADAGDNPVDTYPAAHGFATTKEHRFVQQLGVDPNRYEECIAEGLERCIRRFIKLGTKASPPRDVWCGPVLDDPDKDDKEIIRILRAKGVHDAFKLSKSEVHYGVGPDKCRDCAMFGDGETTGITRPCSLVSGLVRENRWCQRWEAKKEK